MTANTQSDHPDGAGKYAWMPWDTEIVGAMYWTVKHVSADGVRSVVITLTMGDKAVAVVPVDDDDVPPPRATTSSPGSAPGWPSSSVV